MHKHAIRGLIKDLGRYRVPSRSTQKAVLSILEGLNTPRSLTVWLLFSNGEHQQLVDLDCDPSGYEASPAGASRFRDDYLATSLLSKADFLQLPLDRKDVAMDKFFAAERSNHLTNSFWTSLDANKISGVRGWLLNAVCRKIDSILGEFDPAEWFDLCSWGPGATFDLGGLDTSPVNKFRREAGITLDLYQLVEPLIEDRWPLWASSLRGRYCFTPGNKITTVPKNAKTDRVIAIEPGLNVFFQLGLGRMISRRLLRSEGIDLNTQERNGLLAFYASMSGSLGTVDFSSASDMISTEVVRQIIPHRWFQVLDLCRSKLSLVGDKFQRMEKFSSMGNGFTFPLQSLIFFAMAHACCSYAGVSSDYVGVFGDDVVIPVDVMPIFQDLCVFFGFKINASKSFTSGVFRESCGTHYFWGTDVKPIYIKVGLCNVESVYRLANAVRRLAHRRNFGYGCDARLRTAWVFLYCLVPKKFRFAISEGYGDGGYIDNFDSATPSVHKPRRLGYCIEGYLVPALAHVAVKRESTGLELLLARLFYPSVEREYGNTYSLRTATRRRYSLLHVHSWKDLGAWF
jgi:hypothetical protein